MIEGTSFPTAPRQAQGPYTDLALHTLGWKAFQDLCADVCEVVLKRPVEIFREAQDGGQDAVFRSTELNGEPSEVATIQCKFTSKPNEKLQLGDLSEEMESVKALFKTQQADTYIVITNRRIDAPDAVRIRKRLRELGVRHPHIFGKHFLTRVIRSSSRLRALVPRVYGLGDLSFILDERSARQTEALLGHLKPLLKVYVPTQPHVDAVRTLAKHGIVLLLGGPGAGKSTIAAILATVAADDKERVVFRADGPKEFSERWNPDERGFFWIDDAFGPNQLSNDFVDRWLGEFPKLQTALARGSQFVLTSRLHIYNGAEAKLGSRNLSLFRERQAIVNVGRLSPDERLQMLYNHVKAGSQPWEWKSRIKPHLKTLAQDENLFPEIARRLADPAYTRQLSITETSLAQFVREPKAHLLQTIRELSKEHRAALTLVFLHHGKMPLGNPSTEMHDLVTRYFLIDRESLWQAVTQLRDAFLVQQLHNGTQSWMFKHPTIADAISTFLGETEGLVELYLRGTRPEVVLSEVQCSGATVIQDATVVPESLNELLAAIVGRLPDEQNHNLQLFSFLDERASDGFFRALISANPSLLARKTGSYRRLGYDSRIKVHARALKFGILPEGVRNETAAELAVAFSYFDTTFLDDDDILAILPPSRLLGMMVETRSGIAASVAQEVASITEQVDFDVEPEEHFYELRRSLADIKRMVFGTEDGEQEPLIGEIDHLVDAGVEEVAAKQKAHEEQKDDGDFSEWENVQPTRPSITAPIIAPPVGSRGSRSIFSDVDD